MNDSEPRTNTASLLKRMSDCVCVCASSGVSGRNSPHRMATGAEKGRVIWSRGRIQMNMMEEHSEAGRLEANKSECRRTKQEEKKQ